MRAGDFAAVPGSITNLEGEMATGEVDASGVYRPSRLDQFHAYADEKVGGLVLGLPQKTVAFWKSMLNFPWPPSAGFDFKTWALQFTEVFSGLNPQDSVDPRSLPEDYDRCLLGSWTLSDFRKVERLCVYPAKLWDAHDPGYGLHIHKDPLVEEFRQGLTGLAMGTDRPPHTLVPVRLRSDTRPDDTFSLIATAGSLQKLQDSAQLAWSARDVCLLSLRTGDAPDQYGLHQQSRVWHRVPLGIGLAASVGFNAAIGHEPFKGKTPTGAFLLKYHMCAYVYGDRARDKDDMVARDRWVYASKLCWAKNPLVQERPESWQGHRMLVLSRSDEDLGVDELKEGTEHKGGSTGMSGRRGDRFRPPVTSGSGRDRSKTPRGRPDVRQLELRQSSAGIGPSHAADQDFLLDNEPLATRAKLLGKKRPLAISAADRDRDPLVKRAKRIGVNDLPLAVLVSNPDSVDEISDSTGDLCSDDDFQAPETGSRRRGRSSQPKTPEVNVPHDVSCQGGLHTGSGRTTRGRVTKTGRGRGRAGARGTGAGGSRSDAPVNMDTHQVVEEVYRPHGWEPDKIGKWPQIYAFVVSNTMPGPKDVSFIGREAAYLGLRAKERDDGALFQHQLPLLLQHPPLQRTIHSRVLNTGDVPPLWMDPTPRTSFSPVPRKADAPPKAVEVSNPDEIRAARRAAIEAAQDAEDIKDIVNNMGLAAGPFEHAQLDARKQAQRDAVGRYEELCKSAGVTVAEWEAREASRVKLERELPTDDWDEAEVLDLVDSDVESPM
jgi:hypothetical protein